MMMSQWLRRLIKSHAPILRARSVDNSRPLPRRRLAVALEPLEARLVFSVFIVNSLADGPLASLQGNGTLDLREAIELATHLNTAVDGYTNPSSTPGTFTGTDPALINAIGFDGSLAGKTITLSAIGDGTAGPSAFGVKNGAQLTIDGQTGITTRGITVARASTASAFRLFYVGSTGGLTVKGLTINGFVAQGFVGGGGAQPGGGSAGPGGAIFNEGTLTLINDTLSNNTAQGGNGGAFAIRETGGGGGGLGAAGGTSDLLMGAGGNGGGPNGGSGGFFDLGDLSHFSGFTGGFGGGGGGSAYSTLIGAGGTGGFGGGGGGGAENTDVNVDDGSVSQSAENGGNGGFGGGGGGYGSDDNALAEPGAGGFGAGTGGFASGGGGAGLGGAVFNNAGTVTITNSTITGNVAQGGVNTGATVRAKGLGGGLFSRNGTVTIGNGTFSGNTAAAGARGVFLYGDGAAFTASINKTIIGQSDTSVSDLALDTSDTGSGNLTGTDNLIRSTTVFGSPNNFLNAQTGDPLLGALQDNGGITPTMAPQAGSPVFGLEIGAVPANRPQTVTFAPLANRTFGDADFAISATSTSGLPVSFVASGNATVAQVAGVWYIHIAGVGSATITSVQAGNLSYGEAPGVSRSFSIAKAASVTTTVGAGPFTYNGLAQVGGSGTVTGAGGLSTAATSLTYSANADGTGVADRTNAGTYYVTAHYAGDANHLASDGAAVGIRILARHITATFTAASKVYDGKTSATVTSRSLIGVIGADVVSLTGGAATFASKNVGTWTVSLNGSTLSGAAAGNYVLDSVATTTASITPKPLTGTAETQSALNVAKNGTLSFRISVAQSGIADGQSVAQLFDGASFALTVGGRTYSVRAQATTKGGVVTVSFRMTDELKAILAANTTATNGGNAQTVALNLSAMSKDGNYTLSVMALTKLFNMSK